MRIAIDARELCGRATGVGRYLSHLLAVWASVPEAARHEFSLYLPTGLDVAAGAIPEAAGRFWTIRLPGGSGTWWEQVSFARALRSHAPDVVFCPAYSGPLTCPAPLVLTIHDLSFVAHPEWFPPRARLRRRLVTTFAARRASRILTDATFGRQEIVTRLGVDEDRVRVVPLALTRPAATLPDARRETSRPVVLYVGSIFNRRHVPELIAATARLAKVHPDIRLEIVGDNRTFPPIDLEGVVAAHGMGDRTRIRSFVSDAVLVELYSDARAFVFLSEYEGFGLTPLEALSYGVPALVGETPVAREVYGDAAEYVSTTDVEAVASRLERLLFDDRLRQTRLAAAGVVLERYSWERTAQATIEVLEEAAR